MSDTKPTESIVLDNPGSEQSTVSRKRRNRWGDVDESTSTPNEETKSTVESVEASSVTTNNEAQSTDDAVPRIRRSRWGAAEAAAPIPLVSSSYSLPVLPAQTSAPPMLTDEIIQQTVILKLQLQQANQKLLSVAQDALRIEQDPNRSPSPPPKYDSSGKRTNTREVRMRESLTNQRISIIEQLMKLNPTFQPPIDFIRAKPIRKIYIPKQKDPNYNFIGLIIGPRGHTQKQMEQETGCKISIRGKGSAKEGSKARAVQQTPDDDDELHVHISGETDDNVNKAVKLVEALLKPMDDTVNEHKQRQLRELALINGTLREDEYCPVCGEKGHRQFDCPYRAKAFKAAGVKCAICGDLSHPTRDCPMKQCAPTNEASMDNEYDSFLAELNGEKSSSKPSSATSSSTADGAAGGGSILESLGLKKNVSGPTVLTPIVDVISKKPGGQTIIHATLPTLLPVLTGSNLSHNTNTATTPAGSTTSDPMMMYNNYLASTATSPAPISPAPGNPTAAMTMSYDPNASWTSSTSDATSATAGDPYSDPQAMAAYYAQYYAYYAAMYPGMDMNTLMAMQQQQAYASAGYGYMADPNASAYAAAPTTSTAPPPPAPLPSANPPPPPPPSDSF